MFLSVFLLLIGDSSPLYALQPSCNHSYPLMSLNGMVGYWDFTEGAPSNFSINRVGLFKNALPNFQVSPNAWCLDTTGICPQMDDTSFSNIPAQTGNFSYASALALNQGFTLQIWFYATLPSPATSLVWSIGNWLTANSTILPCPEDENIIGQRTSLHPPNPLGNFLLEMAAKNGTKCVNVPIDDLAQPFGTLHVASVIYQPKSFPNVIFGIDGDWQAFQTFLLKNFTKSTNLVLGINYGLNQSEWSGSIFRVVVWNRTMSMSEAYQNQFVALPFNPPYGVNQVVQVTQGNMFPTPFNFTVLDFDTTQYHCPTRDYSLVIWTIPAAFHGFFLIWNETHQNWDALSSQLPYLISHFKTRKFAYVPFSRLDFGTPFAEMTFSAVEPGDPLPTQSPDNIATIFFNIRQVELSPIALNSNVNNYGGTSSTILLDGINPNPPFPNGTEFGAIQAAYVTSLPVLGSLRIQGSSHVLTPSELPVKVPNPRIVIYTSFPPDFSFSGQNSLGQDNIEFLVWNGNSYSQNTGEVTINLLNPLVQLPQQNSTIEIRTTIRSFLNVRGENLAQPTSPISIKIIQLPTKGTLLIQKSSGSFLPATNISALGFLNPSSLFYRPFALTVGPVDYILFRVVNSSNSFFGSLSKLTFFVNDPGIWVAPANQPIQVQSCEFADTVTCPTAYFQMIALNGDQELPSSVFTVTITNPLGSIVLSHPELYPAVKFLFGTPNGGSSLITFTGARSICNLLMQNMSFSTNLVGPMIVIFTQSDINVNNNFTLYTVDSTVHFNAPIPPASSESFPLLPTWALALVVAAIAVCVALCIYGIYRAVQFTSAMTGNILYKKKHIKRQKKLDKIEKEQKKTLNKQNKERDKLERQREDKIDKHLAKDEKEQGKIKSQQKKTDASIQQQQKEIASQKKQMSALQKALQQQQQQYGTGGSAPAKTSSTRLFKKNPLTQTGQIQSAPGQPIQGSILG